MSNFGAYTNLPNGPARNLVPVVPSDTSDLPKGAYFLRCTQPGALRITTGSGDILDTEMFYKGEFLPCDVRRVHATGTTAHFEAGEL